MAGVTLRVDSKDLDRVSRHLQKILDRFADTRNLMEAIGASLVSSTQLRFEEGQNPEGQPWKPWSASYAARRRGEAILLDKGRLSDSLTFVAGPDRVEVGTNVIYAAIHQFGGEEVGIPIPARPYLGLSGDDTQELLEMIDDWASRQLEA